MTYKTHVSTALLVSSIYFIYIQKIDLSLPIVLLLAIFTIIGSSVPDLDTPTGKVWHKVPAGSIIGRIVSPIFIGGHRHLSHSLLGMGLFTCLFSLLIHIVAKHFSVLPVTDDLILLSFIMGYFSHIFADLFTEAGVPLLFPIGYHFGIPPDPLGKVRIKTGKWFENLIIYPAVNIALVVIIYEYLKNRQVG